MEKIKTRHYIRVDEKDRVIKGFSTAFEEPLNTDICINTDGGRHFELFGVINLPLFNEKGIYIYKYASGSVTARTAEEIAADEAALPKPEKTDIEILEEENTLLKAQVTAIGESQEFLEDCLIEMAQAVYA